MKSILTISILLSSIFLYANNEITTNLEEGLKNPLEVEKYFLKDTNVFPVEILKFKNLKHLHIHNCSFLEFPININCLDSLNSLMIEQMNYIPKNISKISNLRNLEIVNLLEEFEKVMDIRIPEEMRENKKLLFLRFHNAYPCEGIEYIKQIKGLNFLNTGLENTTFYDDIEKFKFLESLLLINNDLTRFPKGITKLKNLKTLVIFASKINTIKGIKKLKKLEDLTINNTLVSEFKEITKLKNLKKIDISSNIHMTEEEKKFLNENIKADKILIK